MLSKGIYSIIKPVENQVVRSYFSLIDFQPNHYVFSNIKSKTFTQNEIRSFLVILMRVIYTNNKLDIGLQLFEDEDFRPYILGSYPALFILNKLSSLGRYEDLIKYFELQIPYFSKNSFSIETPIIFRQPWPIDHIELAVEALFKLVGQKTCHMKFKSLKTNEDAC